MKPWGNANRNIVLQIHTKNKHTKKCIYKIWCRQKAKVAKNLLLKAVYCFQKKNNETPFVIDPSKLKAELPWLGFTDD